MKGNANLAFYYLPSFVQFYRLGASLVSALKHSIDKTLNFDDFGCPSVKHSLRSCYCLDPSPCRRPILTHSKAVEAYET